MKRKIANKVFDEMIEQAVKDYVEEKPEKEYDKVTFSKEHEQKMSQLFEEVAKREENRKRMNVLLKSAAIFVIAIMMIGIFAPKISAWKERIIQFFMKDKKEYSWVAYGDKEELKEKPVNTNKDEYDISFLEYVPEGFEVDKYDVGSRTMLIRLINTNKEIIFKISKNTKRAIDTEDVEAVHEEVDGKDIMYCLKGNDEYYLWSNNEMIFDLHGNIEKEELIKIIEKINYEKIEKIFQ